MVNPVGEYLDRASGCCHSTSSCVIRSQSSCMHQHGSPGHPTSASKALVALTTCDMMIVEAASWGRLAWAAMLVRARELLLGLSTLTACLVHLKLISLVSSQDLDLSRQDYVGVVTREVLACQSLSIPHWLTPFAVYGSSDFCWCIALSQASPFPAAAHRC